MLPPAQSVCPRTHSRLNPTRSSQRFQRSSGDSDELGLAAPPTVMLSDTNITAPPFAVLWHASSGLVSRARRVLSSFVGFLIAPVMKDRSSLSSEEADKLLLYGGARVGAIVLTFFLSAYSMTLMGAEWQMPRWRAPTVRAPALKAPSFNMPVVRQPVWSLPPRFKAQERGLPPPGKGA